MSIKAPDALPPNSFELTVARVESGGNTPDGKHFYSFDPPLLMANQPCQMGIYLSGETPSDITLRKVLTSDPSQFEKFDPTPDGRGFTFRNLATVGEVISIAVIVKDPSSPFDAIICDPQVINNPD